MVRREACRRPDLTCNAVQRLNVGSESCIFYVDTLLFFGVLLYKEHSMLSSLTAVIGVTPLALGLANLPRLARRAVPNSPKERGRTTREGGLESLRLRRGTGA